MVLQRTCRKSDYKNIVNPHRKEKRRRHPFGERQKVYEEPLVSSISGDECVQEVSGDCDQHCSSEEIQLPVALRVAK